MLRLVAEMDGGIATGAGGWELTWIGMDEYG